MWAIDGLYRFVNIAIMVHFNDSNTSPLISHCETFIILYMATIFFCIDKMSAYFIKYCANFTTFSLRGSEQLSKVSSNLVKQVILSSYKITPPLVCHGMRHVLQIGYTFSKVDLVLGNSRSQWFQKAPSTQSTVSCYPESGCRLNITHQLCLGDRGNGKSTQPGIIKL